MEEFYSRNNILHSDNHIFMTSNVIVAEESFDIVE